MGWRPIQHLDMVTYLYLKLSFISPNHHYLLIYRCGDILHFIHSGVPATNDK